jgi:hypothetical protein
MAPVASLSRASKENTLPRAALSLRATCMLLLLLKNKTLYLADLEYSMPNWPILTGNPLK